MTPMPRSIQEILNHADERLLEDYLLQRAVLAGAQSEGQVVEAVVAPRGAGISWKRIGELLGTSAQAAQWQYEAFVNQADA